MVSEAVDAWMIVRSCLHCIEIARAENRPLYLSFLDISGAYDNVNRELLWRILKDEGIGHQEIELLKETYRDNTAEILRKE